MSRRVTQTSNTISPEISTRVDMDTILATVDPEIEATQTNFTFEKASIPEDEVPLCVTQFPQAANKSSLPAEVVIGLMNEIPRWVRGSVINFAAYSGGYPKAEDAVYAAQQLNRAALFWNSKRVGVTFRWVKNVSDAAFVLGFGPGANPGLIARAFFPNNIDHSDMLVFQTAFQPIHRPHLWRYFLHELGHVLGLRHEFALAVEVGGFQFGPRDPLSVMNYRSEPPMITQNDVDCTTALYWLPGGKIGTIPLALYVPDN